MFHSLIVLLLLVFAGRTLPAEDTVRTRIIYLIHGDGNYTYHDNGTEQLSDETVMQQALANAVNGIHSEYFIFHFRPKRTFLLFFPGAESEFYHYRNGKLITQKTFFRFDPVDGQSAESWLIKESSPLRGTRYNILLYYGHEIPEEEQFGYNASFPEVPFGLKAFKGDVAEILKALKIPKFDLLVLSTCNNGSPPFIFGLADKADYIIASPGELHLSQMNSTSLQQLEQGTLHGMNAFALQFASAAFEILRLKVLTEVVISVYNAKELLNKYYPDQMCSDQSQSDDVRVFFRPSKFGVNKNKIDHSGWYCKDDKSITSSGSE